MAVTIRDLAKMLKISSGTASMALNNRPGVNPKTRQRVIELAKELGYTGSTAKPKSIEAGTIAFVVYKRHGVVVADTQFFTELTQSIENAARKRGYAVTLLYCAGTAQTENTLETIRKARLQGLLLLGTEMTVEDFEPFKKAKLPTMLLDCNLIDCGADRVLINNTEGIRQAISYLYSCSHRKIGYLHSLVSIQNFEERAMGYRQAMLEFDLKPDRLFLLEPTVEGACRDMEQQLKEEKSVPPALIADNDLIAFGAMKALKKSGYQIPGDVSIIGFDNVPACILMEPELTSIDVHASTLGETAVWQLIQRIKEPKTPFLKLEVGTTLCERHSVRPFAET